MLCQLSYCPSAPPATVIRRPQRLSEGAPKQWWFATKRSSVLTKLARVEPSPRETKLAGVEPSPSETKLAGVEPSPSETKLAGVEPSPSETTLAGVEPSSGETLFHGGEQHAGRKAVDRRRDVVGGWEAGSDPDVAVPGIPAIRESGTRARHRDARLFGQGDDSSGRVVGYIEADEVTAVGVGPGRGGELAQSLLKDGGYELELWGEEISMLAHQRSYAVRAAEEPGMPQVIDLVRADGPLAQLGQIPIDVGWRAREERHAGTGEGDLGRGGEQEHSIRVAGRGRHAEDVERRSLDISEMVHGVRVVPEDPEIRSRRRHRHQGVGDLLGIDRTGRIGVCGNDPDALDGGIVGDQLTDLIDVRTGIAEGYGEHLDAELLAQREMAVVARHRAEEADG